MIPQLDLGPYLAGSVAAREALAKELQWIQENIGFYVVVNHGVDQEPIRRAARAMREFFALPLAEKLRIRINEKSVGYVPARSTVYVTSVINRNTRPDLNETITIARERPAGDPDILAGLRFVGPNQWPASLPEFRGAMIAYQEALSKLGYAMLPLYARALDLPPDYFAPYFTRPTWWTRNSYYAAMEPDENQFGISPHSDHGFITLLPMSEVPGLEILSPQGEWIPAVPVDRRDHRQHRRIPQPLVQRPFHGHAPPRGGAGEGPVLYGHVLQPESRDALAEPLPHLRIGPAAGRLRAGQPHRVHVVVHRQQLPARGGGSAGRRTGAGPGRRVAAAPIALQQLR